MNKCLHVLTNCHEFSNLQLLIPSNSDTTYWCHLSALPAPIVDEEHYVYRVSTLTVTLICLMQGRTRL